ncbi:MAG: hypothetical protein HC837_07025 [Chloroflexaceae bacterium]|nr:hypothetical protein [Chloroflexaceae bacterium]
MQQAARQLGRPDAARVVIDTVLADTLAPERFSREEREEIAEAARGITVEPGSARIVALYEDHTGIPLGSVPVDQFRSFRRHITDANASDRTAMLNRERLELFRGLGADAELCNQLAARIDRDGSIQVRWVRL